MDPNTNKYMRQLEQENQRQQKEIEAFRSVNGKLAGLGLASSSSTELDLLQDISQHASKNIRATQNQRLKEQIDQQQKKVEALYAENAALSAMVRSRGGDPDAITNPDVWK